MTAPTISGDQDVGAGQSTSAKQRQKRPIPKITGKHIETGKAKTKTTYVALQAVESQPDTFKLVGTVAASNDDSAATAAAEEWGEGDYVLVSESSWHPHTRRQTTITKWLKG